MKHSNKAVNGVAGLSQAQAIIPEDDAATSGTLFAEDPEAGSNGTRKRANALSDASTRYDVGGKGYLTPSERDLRNYDVNNDGDLDINEMKSIVRDLKESNRDKDLLKKLAMGATSCLAVFLLGNFGLIWSVVALTRQLGATDGHLVDSSTGKLLSTQARGNHQVAVRNDEFSRRLTDIAQGHRPHEDMKRLLQEEPIISTLLNCDRACAQAYYQDYQSGITTSWSSYTVDGTEYTKQLGSGATHAIVDGCDVYDKLVEVGKAEPLYKLKCCGANDCTVHPDASNSARSLVAIWAGCFSPVSTVIEKTKGKTFYKDLVHGDRVLAANGVFRTFLFMAHSNPSKRALFLQIHTDSTEDAPLEITDQHLLFLDGQKLPILAGDVKVGDKLVGVSEAMAVTKITSVTRDGIYAAMTSEATHFVDGVLASSVTTLKGKTTVQLGLVKMHIHTAWSHFLGPVSHAICKINPHLCTTQIDDGEGGFKNIMMAMIVRVSEKPVHIQAVLTPCLFILGSVTVLSYYLVLVLLFAMSLACVVKFSKEKEKAL